MITSIIHFKKKSHHQNHLKTVSIKRLMSKVYNSVIHDEWTTVSRKTKQKTGKSNACKSGNKLTNTKQVTSDGKKNKKNISEHMNTSLTHQFGLAEIKSHLLTLRNSSVFAKVKDELQQLTGKFDSVMGLGIGSFTTSPSSLLQFCLLILMSEVLVTCGEAVSNTLQIFDPTMTILDSSICTELNITINKENKMGKYEGSGRTLFFMPHCPYRLYCNLLWQNWNQLSNVVILGNR
jgi:hypothetical protein